MKFSYLLVYISLILSTNFIFQNCQSPFVVNLLNQSEIDIVQKSDLDNSSATLSDLVFGPLKIFGEYGRIQAIDNLTVSISPDINNQIILVWDATTYDRCTLFNQQVPNAGGPVAFDVEANKNYEFRCYKDNFSKALTIITSTIDPGTFKNTNSKVVHVFVVAGQSNAFGQDIERQKEKPIQSDLWRYQNSKIQEINHIGAWSSFAKKYTEEFPVNVLLVSAAKGGSSANKNSDLGAGYWDNGDLLENAIVNTKNAISEIKKRGLVPELRGVLWVQGESDAIAINNNKISLIEYENSILSITNHFRNQLSQSLPIFIFKTGYAVNHNRSGFEMIQIAQSNLVNKNNNNIFAFIDAPTFIEKNMMWDDFHYSTIGYNYMGLQSASVVTRWLSNNRPPSCHETQPICHSNKTCSLINGKPQVNNQPWVAGKADCSFICNTGFTGADCSQTVPQATEDYNSGNINSPINGGWSAWTNSGNCSKACDGGTQLQVRTCNNPLPAHGGQSCAGPNSQSVTCNSQACPTSNQSVKCEAKVLNVPKVGFYSTNEDISMSLISDASSKFEIGRSSTVYGDGLLVSSDSNITLWGQSNSQVLFNSAKDIKPYIDPLLIKYKSVIVIYELYIKKDLNWNKCNSSVSIHWK